MAKNRLRIHPAILAAIITCCGGLVVGIMTGYFDVVAAVIQGWLSRPLAPIPELTLSPTLPFPTAFTDTPSPTSTLTPTGTPTATPTDTPTPTPTVSDNAIVEDFDDGEAQGFRFEGGGTWQINEGSESMVLEVRTDESSQLHIDLPPVMFTHNIIEFQINFKEIPESLTEDTEDWGGLDFIFREQIDGNESYLLAIRPPLPLRHIELNYVPTEDAGGNSPWQPIQGAAYTIAFEPDAWQTIRLELNGNDISVSLDGTLMYSVTDSRLEAGALVFLVRPDALVQFDNIKATP